MPDNGETTCDKTINIKYVFSAEWADEESEAIVKAAASITCGCCNGDDEDDGNGDGED